MGQRADALAAELERVNTAWEQAIAGCSDDDWRRVCSGEGWSVGVTAHHVATTRRPILEMVQALANGQLLPPVTSEMIHAANARHAEEHASCTRAETLELHRRDASAAADAVRELGDEQLDRTAPLALAGGVPVSAQQMIEDGLIGHPRDHLASIRTAVAHRAA